MKNLDEMSKEQIVRTIAETALVIAAGYRQTHCHQCRDGETAASNVGYFALRGLGYSHDETKALFDDVRATAEPVAKVENCGIMGQT